MVRRIASRKRESEGGIPRADAHLGSTKLPEGPAWSYELKFDGYRALGLRPASGRVRLLSRNDKDFTERFASITHALKGYLTTVVDCEIVA